MELLGSGIDIVSIDRIKRIVDRYGQRFIGRILHASEMQEVLHLHNPNAFIAKRFAAKEAAAKALGVGIGKQLHFTDMQITHDGLGKPVLCFSEDSTQRLQLQNKRTLLTISDEHHYAVAHVMLYA